MRATAALAPVVFAILAVDCRHSASLAQVTASPERNIVCRTLSWPRPSLDARAIEPGRYKFIVAATSIAGRASNIQDAGVLTLIRSRADDVSPRTGEKAETTEPPGVHGALTIGFDRLRIPIADGSGGTPPPQSLDPVFPGIVLMFGLGIAPFDNWDMPGNVRLPFLTANNWYNNRRRPKHVLPIDWTSLNMVVFEIRAGSFRGWWDASGNRSNKTHGYFCAFISN